LLVRKKAADGKNIRGIIKLEKRNHGSAAAAGPWFVI
jgi:hypothetical protein